MPSHRLIRRQPLADRIKAYLDPLDFLLWLSEQFDSDDWDQWQRDWSMFIGLAMNLVMLIARANSGTQTGGEVDDVFGEEYTETGWLNWFCTIVVHILSLLSIMNATYTFYRKRHYRLFESSIEDKPSTPSAHRVRVDSSPVSSSPLRFLTQMLGPSAAEARAHPDASRDVWEISVWDPIPICQTLFCLFSPGHIVVYWLFLPVLPQDPRPSTTVVTTIALIALLSSQLSILQKNFSQQAKDSTVIHKEVLSEYDVKYVQPLAKPLVRDVGTQFSSSHNSSKDHSPLESRANSVDTYIPTFVVNRGYKTRPNPNYADHYNPDGARLRAITPSRSLPNGVLPSYQTPVHLRDVSSPIQPRTAIRQPQARKTVDAGTGGGGGSLGVYSHAQSPLKKATSMHFSGRRGEKERSSSPFKREGSPLKRTSVPGGSTSTAPNLHWPQLNDTSTRRESGRF
ncbi:hypothetical protein MMC26_002526 [Xylographa opegraphella]|nr:hypothetical protein [Xylographa opegraphella]